MTGSLRILAGGAVLVCLGTGCPAQTLDSEEQQPVGNESHSRASETVEVATLGEGCFWCVEAVFEQLDGVLSVDSGYSGGSVPHPTYEQVSTGTTGHAEVCRIRFDPGKIDYAELLEVFWKTHDPTTLNRQGPDVGTQYRSVIFYHNPRQKELAEKTKRELDASGAWSAPIVTQIVPATEFYRAEDYHQDYFRNHPDRRYCVLVVRPKVKKFQKVFGDKLRSRPH